MCCPVNGRWFRWAGWVPVPVAWQGALATLLPFAFCVNVFLVIDSRSHSVSDTLYGILPYWAPTFGLWMWAAWKTRQRDADAGPEPSSQTGSRDS